LFEGSKRYIPYPFPLFSVRRAGTPVPFSATRDGFGFSVFDYGPFSFGPVGHLKLPRWERSDGALQGLGNVGLAVEVGAFAQFWWTPWLRTRAEVRQGFGGHHGLVADLTGDVVVPATPLLTLSGGPRLSLATSRADIFRALLEAVALRLAAVHARLRPLAAPDHAVIASGGALSRSPTWAQIVADALGLPVRVAREAEASSRGAALLGGERLGRPLPLELVDGEVVDADPARHVVYQAALARQQALYEVVVAPGES